MEPTVPPWRTPWRRVHRIRLSRGQLDDYWHAPRLSLYTGHYLRPGDQHASSRHLISHRFDDGVGPRVVFPTAANPWLNHIPVDTEPWRQPMPIPPEFKKGEPIDSYIPDEGPPPPEPRSFWSDSTLGWVAGTVLLAVFLLIVRATERCLDRRLFKGRRRQSEEWQTPNVMATSHQHADSESITDPELQIDPPPPYSECARPKSPCEDPPPPYSDCYVAFRNHKDGDPSAHIIMPERNNDNYSMGNIEANIGSQNNPNTDGIFVNIGAVGANVGDNAGSQDNASLNRTCINIGGNAEVVGVNVGSQYNTGPDVICINIRSEDNANENESKVENVDGNIRDGEANRNSLVEIVGVHISSNTETSRDCTINGTVKI